MMGVKSLHILGPEPPGDNDTPLSDHGLPVGPVEGGEGAPDALVLLVDHLEDGTVLLVPVTLLDEVQEELVEGIALINKGHRALKPRQQVRGRGGQGIPGEPVRQEVVVAAAGCEAAS